MLIHSNWVSVLFNEPKLLKFNFNYTNRETSRGFSALQRAEIAEIVRVQVGSGVPSASFSALQRAEIAEIQSHRTVG